MRPEDKTREIRELERRINFLHEMIETMAQKLS
jgi:hypothetical protein